MYYIFISHSWKYPDAYQFIVDSLNNYLGEENWRDYSIPQDDPIHTNGTDRELYEAIKRKIQCCSCVIILAGVYASYSKWIDKEIQIAQELGKPIIAVKHWGAQRISTIVSQAADEIVGWNGPAIAKAVEDLC